MAGAIVGTLMAVLGGLNFVGYYEGFLLFLDYWITPWIGILLVMFYVYRIRDWSWLRIAQGSFGGHCWHT
ncbi:hypothetical protein [Vulcanisaeta sp. JCM 14467]|uniref:hypothetical protein n=1 Tax=Vulcanisaeta sp. JCM 14467 TaxID=1295370 RepID=UPI0006D26EDD|nr:hypothetical protein [Vulcanisaeta sp. JCM 14467]